MPPAAPPPAWSPADLAALHHRDDKHARVRAMFAAIARRYDLNNRIHSLGLDQAWRRAAVKAANVRPGDHVLDCACGTGDLAIAFARRSPAARVVGTDFTPEMLALAQPKARRLGPAADRLAFGWADAMDLPFDDASFDVVSIAFGIRNVQDVPRALAQFRRVLRPGGRLVVLEFDIPANPLVRWGNRLYCQRLMPLTATLIAHDRSGAYRYLPRSVDTFLDSAQLAAAIRDAGFDAVTPRPLTLGVCACTSATKPSPS